MKISFIEPLHDLKSRYGSLADIGALMPPLGIAYICAVLKENGHQADFIDSTVEKLSWEKLKEILKKLDAEVIGIPVFTITFAGAKRLTKAIRELRPDIKIILGGPHCSGNPEKTLQESGADFVIYGEGEYPTLNLLNALEKKLPLKDVKSLVYKDEKGDIIKNEFGGFITNLNRLPMPDRSIFKLENYHHSGEHRGKNIMHLITSRGCPWACAFCTTQQTFGKKIRYRSSEKVFEEMKLLVEHYNADEIFFYDDTLTANKKNIEALCNLIIENSLKIIWGCYTRVDCVSPETLKLMAKSGCYQINYGIESGSQRLLDIITKGFTVEQAKKAVRWTQEAGIESICTLILGLPGETHEESLQTIQYAIDLDPTYVQFYLTMPYKGTPLYDIAAQYGSVITEEIDGYSVKTHWEIVHYVPYGRTEKELKKLIQVAYKKFYFRPRYIMRRLNNLRKLPFDKMVKMCIAGFKIIFREWVIFPKSQVPPAEQET